MPQDVTNQVLITPAVLGQWMARVTASTLQLERLQREGRIKSGNDIPDEVLELQDDNSLRLHVTLADGTVVIEMIILPDQWQWRSA